MIQGIIRRRAFMNSPKEEYVINAIDNPKIMAQLYSKGYAKSPDGMTATECSKVTSITRFTESVNYESFDGLKYFTKLESIPSACFSNKNLSGFTLPESITRIGESAFRFGTFPKNYYIVIPSKVSYIGLYAFISNNNRPLNYVFKGTTPPALTDNNRAPENTLSKVGYIYVPDDAVDVYKTAWGDLTFNETTGTALDKIKPMSELPI